MLRTLLTALAHVRPTLSAAQQHAREGDSGGGRRAFAKVRFLQHFGGLALLLIVYKVADAAPVYVQAPTITNAMRSDVDYSPPISNRNFGADQFILPNDDTIRSVTWRGIYLGDYSYKPSYNELGISDDFTINFYSESESEPGSLLVTFAIGNPIARIDTGQKIADRVYEYSADLGAGVFLSGSTAYFISIYNHTTVHPNSADDQWYWALNLNMNQGYGVQSNDLSDWWFNGYKLYFALDNANISSIPTPPAVYLFGSALGVMGWMRRH